MSVLFALLIATSPAATTTEAAPAKKPRLRCEWIHEVGTSRPRRVCEKVQPKADEAVRPETPAAEKKEGATPAGSDN